jgi:amidase
MSVQTLDAFATATNLLRALRAQQVSSVELLDLYLGRIARHNPTLNAIVVPDYERARELAVAADAARGRGEERPLLGLPMTLKESINRTGLRTTAGVPAWAEYTSPVDAPVAARVLAAGAVVMGKTNVPPLLDDWQSNNAIYGRTNNPWDLERTPGGSTGGGSAALAAGLTALEFGSDIGGSIRVPAAFCGVYGHKPSETALPRSGQFPIPPLPNAANALGVQGPLARSAEDLELAFGVVAGPDVGEDVAWRLEIPAARHERLADFRVATLPWLDWVPVDREIVASFEAVVATLRRAGARVQEATPEGFDARQHHSLYLSLLNAVTGSRVDAQERRTKIERLRRADDEFTDAKIRGLEASAADYLGWHGQRERLRAAYRAFFRDWDLVLAPITLVPAFPHYPLESPTEERRIEVDGQEIAYGLQVVYPGVATLPGHPATAFPTGFTQAGLPIGLQAIGPYLEDRTPMRFASLLGQEIGGYERPPGYDVAG